MKRIALTILLASFLVPSAASADEPSPTVGIPVPDPSIATQSDTTALETNPAGLGYLQGFEASYGVFLPSEDFRGVVPSGHSMSLGFGSWLGGFAVGVQSMENPALGPDRTSFGKLTLGSGLSFSRHLSVGGTANFFASRHDERFNELRTSSFGLQWRPTRGIGVGLTARDVLPEFLDEQRALPARLGAGIALRGFDGRMVLETETHYVSGSDRFEVRPRLAVEPLGGFRLFGRGIVGLSLPDRDAEAGFEGASVGMELSAGVMGLQGAQHLGAAHPGPTEFDGAMDMTGGAYRAWIGTPQKRSLFTPRNRWIRLQLDDAIVEQAASAFLGPPEHSFLNLINDLDAIAADPSVAGVIINVDNVGLGHAQIWELHQAFDRLHDAGKESLAIIDTEMTNTRVVYTASAAEEVWMRPNTTYMPTGLNVELTSFAEVLDRLGIEAEFLRIGDYKSAPEAFVSDEPSEPAIEQIDDYLDALYDGMTDRIAERRGLDPDDVRAIVDATPLHPAEALDREVIDRIAYGDEIRDALDDELDAPLGIEDGYQRYEIADLRWGGHPEIAVVYVDGIITNGRSGRSPFGGESITGAETLTRILSRLQRDSSVKAIVLRVDSGGGSATGSDEIYRALRNAAGEKPVVASMGNVAASGGYYVAAGADEIFATPVSLTGSIGIFTGKFNLQSLAESIGIGVHRERRGERAGLFSAWQPWTDSELEAIADSIEYLYQLFIQQIARTRDLTADEVDDVGRGRVWTGEAAHQAQLTDSIGGIADAIRRAEELAGLEPGEALYTDRTGTGATALAPGMLTRFGELFERFGLVDPNPVAEPAGQIPQALGQIESSMLWPLYFEAGEAVFMAPYHVSFE